MTIFLKLPVNRKTLTATVVLTFLFLLVAGAAKANPWIIFEPATPIPGTIPPVITLSSPQNNTAYTSNNVCISFNVSKPQPPTPLDAGISQVKYELDGNVTGVYFCNHYSSDSPPGIPECRYSSNLTIPDGEHTLVVYATGVVLPGDLTIFWMNSNVTVVFSVGLSQSELEPTPSPSPSPATSSSSQETENQSETQPFPTTLVAASVASAAVAGVSLVVYIGKVKKGKAE